MNAQEWEKPGGTTPPKSCKERTSAVTCVDHIMNSDAAWFSEAYWDIGYVRVFT